MAALAIAAIGLAVSGVGAYTSYQAGQEVASAQAEAIGFQQQAEAQRKKQMELDATRRRRQEVRQMIAARSTALSTITNQGASGGSALPGVEGGISGQGNTNILGINQNLEIGRSIFGYNMGVSDAYRRAAEAGGDEALGRGLTSLGGAMMTSSQFISKVGQTGWGMFGNTKPVNTSAYNPARAGSFY